MKQGRLYVAEIGIVRLSGLDETAACQFRAMMRHGPQPGTVRPMTGDEMAEYVRDLEREKREAKRK